MKSILPLGIFAAVLIQGHLNAATLFSDVVVGEGDQDFGFALDSQTSTTSASASGGSSHNVDGIGGSGDLEFQGQGTATSAVQMLRSSVSGSISNSYFDENYDFQAETGEVPTSYFVQSISQFSETLQYGGTATTYNSRYILRLTGNISGSGFATVSLTHGSEPTQRWFFSEPGAIDMVLTSSTFVHGLSPQTFTLEILTGLNFSTEFLGDGGSDSGSADFGNTLEVLGIDLRDENGVLAPDGSVMGDSGSNYAIIPVPEPSTGLLSLIAAATIWRRRRA